MDQKTSSLIEKILKHIVIFGSFLVVLIPVVIVPYSYFPYIIQKTNILKILVQIIFAAYVPLALWKAEYRPKKTLLFWSVMAFAGAMLITTFTSLSVYRSWWGNWERNFGTFNYLHYFAWFIALVGVCNQPKYWRWLLNFSLIVSLGISIYAIFQRLGLGGTFESGLTRVNGTMGNASFLASYMLVHVFIALLFLVEKISLPSRIGYLLILLADFTVLQLTATRGAQFGFIFALVLFIILTFTLRAWEQKGVKLLVFFSLGVFIFVGLALTFRNAPVVKNNYWLRRLSSYSFADNTVQTRLHSWKWGLMGFRDNFILGVGPENYQIVFNKYFEPIFYQYSGSEIWFDRAHNTLVDMASTMGILGLLTYLGLYWAIFYSLLQLYRHQKIPKLYYIVFVLLFFAYFIQNLAVFDSLNNLIVFYLLLAYLCFLSGSFYINQKSQPSKFFAISVNPLTGIGISFILLLVLFFSVDLKQIRENIYVYEAYISGKYGEYAKSMDWYDLTYAKGIYKIDPAILLSTSLGEMIQGKNDLNVSQEQKISDINKAISWMKRAIELDPKNMFLHYLQAKNYALATELTRDVKYLEKGLAAAEQAKELRPGEVRSYWILAQLYLYGSQPQEALKYLQQALKLTDQLPETYYYLAVVYQSLGDKEKYYEQTDQMIDKGFGFFDPNTVKQLIVYYDGKNDLRRLIYLYSQLTALESTDLNDWQTYVDLLVKDKQYDRALETLQNASQAIPAFSSRAYAAYQFITQLKEKAELDKTQAGTTTINQ
ncbi:MAG: O-antigen ligase family protein [Patescibacteria group bacterium]